MDSGEKFHIYNNKIFEDREFGERVQFMYPKNSLYTPQDDSFGDFFL